MDLVRLFVGFATSMLLVSCTPPSITEPPAFLDNQVSAEAYNLGSDLGPDFTSSIYLTRVEQSVRNAAVKVSDPDERGHGSGTYLRMHNRYGAMTRGSWAAWSTVSPRLIWLLSRCQRWRQERQ